MRDRPPDARPPSPVRPSAPPPVLRAESLAVLRGDRLLVAQLDLSLPPGGAILLRGRNGAGKSSLLRVLAGLAPPFAGRLSSAGLDLLADPAAHAARIAYLGHADALKPGLTLAENLRLAARCGGARPPGPAIDHALAALDLLPLATLPARLLSAGQKRRAALARIVLSRAPLWLLDEPTLGLDDAALSGLATLLAAHRAAGGGVVAATHVPLPLAPPIETIELTPPDHTAPDPSLPPS